MATPYDTLGMPLFHPPAVPQYVEIHVTPAAQLAVFPVDMGVVVRAGAKAGVITWESIVHFAVFAAALNPQIRTALEEGLAQLAPRERA